MAVNILGSETMKDALAEGGVTIVDFWADWCGPCKALAPVLDNLSDKYEGTIRVGKVNVSKNVDLAKEYRVGSVPCLIVFSGNKEIDRVVGFNGKDSLEELFIRHS